VDVLTCAYIGRYLLFAKLKLLRRTRPLSSDDSDNTRLPCRTDTAVRSLRTAAWAVMNRLAPDNPYHACGQMA